MSEGFSAALKHRTAGHQQALRRFAMSITVLTVIGHAYLGFEQSYAQPIVAMGTAYALQLLLEWIFARGNNLTPRYLGNGFQGVVDFLLPAHVVALSIAMLLFFNDNLWMVAFTVSVAIASKSVLRVPKGNGSIHFLNPSNFAISFTFLLCPWVGLTMPWQWTAEVSGVADWAFPVLIFVLGFMLHLKHAARIWVIISFLVSFVVQAAVRGAFPETNFFTTLLPATGVPAAIFTFYMAPDPVTSPSSRNGQIVFGSSISLVYAVLVSMHITFALFYALTIVCFGRGMLLLATHYLGSREPTPQPTPQPEVAVESP